MADINDNIMKKLKRYPAPIGKICQDLIAFAQTMPEQAVKEHLDQLVRRAVKREELQQ